eukprot:m.251903 g.251903  ORF g.251903 m.251903 type:complete len:53 (-) comp16153_c0_seq1:447-605(-)
MRRWASQIRHHGCLDDPLLLDSLTDVSFPVSSTLCVFLAGLSASTVGSLTSG